LSKQISQISFRCKTDDRGCDWIQRFTAFLVLHIVQRHLEGVNP